MRRAVQWPQQGQAALVLGSGRPAPSPHEQPAPIASLTSTIAAPAAAGGPGGDAGRHRPQRLLAPGRPLPQNPCQRNHYQQEST